MERIVVTNDRKGFCGAESGQSFVVWGVNYDHDAAGRLLEDYWEEEWETVVADFQEMKELGANTVRIHLQLGKFMAGPELAEIDSLRRLGKVLQLAEETGLYLNITGLGCYHKKDVPAWYDSLTERERWNVQVAFWKEVATVCCNSPAVFCYDLMNEPILAGKKDDGGWLAGELGGKHYVQRLTLDLAGRSREEVAGEWVALLAGAIRGVDDRHLITVGVIPWAQVFKGARPLFHGPRVGVPLDFVSVHFYPEPGKLRESLSALQAYEVGKPLVIEEIFPLRAGIAETAKFIEGSREHCDGWISFYWGKTADEYAEETVKGAMIGGWLRYFREKAPEAGWKTQ